MEKRKVLFKGAPSVIKKINSSREGQEEDITEKKEF